MGVEMVLNGVLMCHDVATRFYNRLNINGVISRLTPTWKGSAVIGDYRRFFVFVTFSEGYGASLVFPGCL